MSSAAESEDPSLTIGLSVFQLLTHDHSSSLGCGPAFTVQYPVPQTVDKWTTCHDNFALCIASRVKNHGLNIKGEAVAYYAPGNNWQQFHIRSQCEDPSLTIGLSVFQLLTHDHNSSLGWGPSHITSGPSGVCPPTTMVLFPQFLRLPTHTFPPLPSQQKLFGHFRRNFVHFYACFQWILEAGSQG